VEHDTWFRQIGEHVKAAMARLRVPGVAVGILHEGRDHLAGFGVTSVEHPQVVDGDTLFQIGSTTKTVTGTALMRLVNAGRFDLDAPVRRYLPEFRVADPATSAQVTLRHLVTHTSGWVGDFFDGTGFGDDALTRMIVRLADRPQLTPVGTTWAYNNAGFYIAGRLIEIATGLTYEDAVDEMICRPLGMTMSGFNPWHAITHKVAVGHFASHGEPRVAHPWWLERAANPVGGMISTARDQLRYARFHLGDGSAPDSTRLLTRDAMRSMQTAHAPAELGGAWGLTWGLGQVGGTRTVRHGGATNGQLSAFLMVPERGFAITVLTNADIGSLLHDEVVRLGLKTYLGLENPDPAPIAVDAATLNEYVGTYEGALQDIELRRTDGGLTVHVTFKGGFPRQDSPPRPAPAPMPAAIIGPDRFAILEGQMKGRQGEFLRDAGGAIVWLRSSRLHRRVPARSTQ
jgi:CubicO group peptidase (beta-lactamase class C family)